MDKLFIPKHVVLIPDGNRRWAKKRGLPAFEGYRKGAENFVQLSRSAYAMGITTFTLWAFSTENWKRTTEEVGGLMHLFEQMIDSQIQEIMKSKIRIIHIGRKDRLSSHLAGKISKAESQTKHFNTHFMVFGLDYGGQDEVIRAIHKIQESEATVTEDNFKDFLDTKDVPNPYPDLIIRTSGEKRTSGFMIWQGAYAEYEFIDKYFPDFTSEDLKKAISDYSLRARRFGK